jgi:hypothetical protein
MEQDVLTKLQELKEKEIKDKWVACYGSNPEDHVNENAFSIFRQGYLQSTLSSTNGSGNQNLTYLKANNETLRKVNDDEPIFILRAQDNTAPGIVLQWISQNMNIVSEAKIKEALQTALAMRRYDHRRNPT